jgi:predicted porin
MLMLLRSPNNRFSRLNKALINTVFSCCFFTTFNIQANKIAGIENVQIHGFIAQGIIDVNGSNFVSDDKNISLELTEVGVNASYQLTSDIRLAGQAVYLDGGNRYNKGVRVDYLLVEWALHNTENWQTKLYLGRIKNYHWLYSSTRDVPMTRPSIILPQSIYFDATRDMAIGGDGGAIATRYSNESLGDIDINVSTGISPISNTQTTIIMGSQSRGDLTQESDFQGSIYWSPSNSQWKFGIATTNADFTYNSGRQDRLFDGGLALERFYINVEYQAENWTFSTELLQENIEFHGLLGPGFSDKRIGQGGFVQGQYRLTPKLQLLARYEHYFSDKNDKNGKQLELNSFGNIPNYFGYQYDTTLGLKYRMSSNLELQFEHHWIQGTARLTPVLIPEPRVNKEEYWQLWALQLMYWF